jgi:GT2 family glycosyltransferase
MDLSIIIVHYKTPNLLINCVSSIYNSNTIFEYEVIVVDNNSEDNSKQIILEKFSKTIWIDAYYNSGFARGNNIGIRKAKGEYVLLLNSDTIINNVFLDKFLRFYKNAETKNNKLGLLGCRIVGIADKKLQVGSSVGFPGVKRIWHANPIYLFFTRNKHKNQAYNPQIMHYKNHKLDYISGCCVMIQRNKLVINNLFLDEDFFLYSEDIEWSYRIQKNGFINYFCGELEIFHVNGGSSGYSLSKKAQVQISEYLYYLKTNSIFMYNLIGLLLYVNFRLDLFLNRKYVDKPEIQRLKTRFKIFKDYFNKIKIYRSPQKKYLRYDS